MVKPITLPRFQKAIEKAKKFTIKKPGQDAFIILDNIRKSNEVFKNSGVVIEDIGDGIINCEFQSKMNTIGGDVLAGLNKAIDLAEKDFDGLVVGNQGANFSVGANIGMIFMMAVEQEYDELIENPLKERRILLKASHATSIQVSWSHPRGTFIDGLRYVLEYGVGVKVKQVEQFR